jgi:hypothetical protein
MWHRAHLHVQFVQVVGQLQRARTMFCSLLGHLQCLNHPLPFTHSCGIAHTSMCNLFKWLGSCNAHERCSVHFKKSLANPQPPTPIHTFMWHRTHFHVQFQVVRQLQCARTMICSLLGHLQTLNHPLPFTHSCGIARTSMCYLFKWLGNCNAHERWSVHFLVTHFPSTTPHN